MKKLILILLIIFINSNIAIATEYVVMDNGLTIIYKQDTSRNMTAVMAFIKGGNYIESESEAGSVNLLHAVMLKGTISRSSSQIALDIEKLGGSIGPEIGNDYSAISLILPTRYFEKGFKIFADILKNPSFPEEEIEKEKCAVIAGIKANNDSIFSYAYDEFLKALYGNFPYYRFIPGTEESVKKIDKPILQKYHSRLFAPNNLVLVFLTSLPMEIIKKLTDKELGDILPFDKGEEKIEEISERSQALLIKKEREFTQAYLMLGYLAPSIDSPDYPAMKIINEIAGAGGSSKIFVALREKEGLAYEIGSFFPTRKYKSGFTLYMGLNAKNIEKARNKLLDEVSGLAEGISQDDIDSAKALIVGRFIMEHESSSRQAWYMGWYQIMGKGYTYDDSYPLEISKVTRDDIKKVCSAYLANNNWTCVQVTPINKK